MQSGVLSPVQLTEHLLERAPDIVRTMTRIDRRAEYLLIARSSPIQLFQVNH